ncbi:MAG: hypothetical protein FWH21_02455, partial [Kiritimatiellaeota bacterium]|nr:hypothetical protein [Kiritimatiellota bacterium]
LCPPRFAGIYEANGMGDYPALFPLRGPCGTVPALGGGVWWWATPTNTLCVLWKVHLGKGTGTAFPAIIGCELYRNGDFVFRYALDPLADYSTVLADFIIGAQNNFGGEGIEDASELLGQNRSLEITWRNFGILDPDGNGSSCGDVFTDWEKVMMGLSPHRLDFDYDGVSDFSELMDGSDPKNPDTDSDSGVDCDDDDALTPYDGIDPAGWLFKVINRLPQSTDLELDTDEDGYPDWLEELSGTDPDDPGDYPDPATSDWYKVTVTLHALVEPPAVLWFGYGDTNTSRRVLLRDPGAWGVWLNHGWDTSINIARASAPVDPSLVTISFDDPNLLLQYETPEWLARELAGLGVGGMGATRAVGGLTPDPFKGGPTLKDPPALRSISNPYTNPAHADYWNNGLIKFGAVGTPKFTPPDYVCFHSQSETVEAKIMPSFDGTYTWTYGDTPPLHGNPVTLTRGKDWEKGTAPDSVSVVFTPTNIPGPYTATAPVWYCKNAAPSTNEVEEAEGGECECDSRCNICGAHWHDPGFGQHCYPHNCHYDYCDICDVWWQHCHDHYYHNDYFDHGDTCHWRNHCDICDAEWCSVQDPPNPCCGQEDEDEAEPEEPQGPDPFSTFVYRGFLPSHHVLNHPVNEHLRGFYPHGGRNYGGGCCPCPAHNVLHQETPATLTHLTPNLRLYGQDSSGALYSIGVSSTVGVGDVVWAGGHDPYSPAPWDAYAVFRWTDGNGLHTVQTNSFTAGSVHTIIDHDRCGSITTNDIRKCLFPPKDGLTFKTEPGKLIKAILANHISGSMPGSFTLSLDSTNNAFRVWPSDSTSGTPLLVHGQTLSGGGLPSGDFYIEALSNGVATLTYAFTGSGNASSFRCAHALRLNAVGTRLETSVTPTNAFENAFATYLPLYDGTNVMATYTRTNAAFHVRPVRLIADVPDTGIKEARFRLIDITRHPGFCGNGFGFSGVHTSSGDDDFSFAYGSNLTNLTVAVTNSKATAELYCKDFGGYCQAVTQFIGSNGTVRLTVTNQIPIASNAHHQDPTKRDYIADWWRQQKSNEWHTIRSSPQFMYDYPSLASFGIYGDAHSDGESPKLLQQHLNGANLSHGSGGDGLTVWQEYRGYWVDGGKDNNQLVGGYFPGGHKRLCPFRKELLVQVAVQDIAADVGDGGAVNPNFSSIWYRQIPQLVIQDAATFYLHPTHGLGIDIYWVFTPFSNITTQASVMGRENGYRYTGDMFYRKYPYPPVEVGLNGSAWISADRSYLDSGLVTTNEYLSVFPQPNGMFSRMMETNREGELPGFVPLLLTSRYAHVSRVNNTLPYTYKTRPELSNAFAVLDDGTPTTPTQLQRGAVVNLVGTAEERPYMNDKGLSHYNATEFRNVAGYSVSHEILHLIGGNHTDNQNTIMGVNGNMLPGLNVTPADELLQINLKTKQGVTP